MAWPCCSAAGWVAGRLAGQPGPCTSHCAAAAARLQPARPGAACLHRLQHRGASFCNHVHCRRCPCPLQNISELVTEEDIYRAFSKCACGPEGRLAGRLPLTARAPRARPAAAARRLAWASPPAGGAPSCTTPAPHRAHAASAAAGPPTTCTASRRLYRAGTARCCSASWSTTSTTSRTATCSTSRRAPACARWRRLTAPPSWATTPSSACGGTAGRARRATRARRLARAPAGLGWAC
jgi:hypothetical protein